MARTTERAAAELRRASGAVRVSLGPGAPVTSFIADGYDWCATGPWRDYAPTDGGMLATEEPTVDVRADRGSQEIRAWWPPVPYPLGWTRALSLEADGELNAHYAVTNAQQTRLPFVWGLPLPLSRGASVAIQVPRARARIARSAGDGMPASGTEFAWPLLRVGDRSLDVSRPAQLGASRAMLCFVELVQGRFTLRDGRHALEVRGTPGVVTHARVWINNGAVSVGPAAGAPDRLSEAVDAWEMSRWVDPGDTIHWDVRFRSLPTSS